LKTHGSLGYARMAVRQSANAGMSFRETHGLLGKLKKLFRATDTRGRQVYQAATKKFSKNAVHPCVLPQVHALQAFSSNAIPCATVRCRATCSGEPHFAPGNPALQGTFRRPRDGQPGHCRTAFPPCSTNLPTRKEKSIENSNQCHIFDLTFQYINTQTMNNLLPYSICSTTHIRRNKICLQ